MTILVLEDVDTKFDAIVACIVANLGDDVAIKRATCMKDAIKQLYEQRFEIIIIDLMMPDWDGENASDKTDDIIPTISTSDLNMGSAAIVITEYADIAEANRNSFIDAGIAIVTYDGVDGKWQNALASALRRAKTSRTTEFLIFAALEKERSGFEKTAAILGQFQNIRGIDCRQISIGGHRGLLVKMPRMGLVDAGVTAARAIEMLRPKMVAMSGICAGVGDDAPLGTIVVADICFEYQAGKWANNEFKMEHYDVPIDESLGTELSQMVNDKVWLAEIKRDLLKDAIVFAEGLPAPMGTGSAVIASAPKLKAIAKQHRKLSAIDMEMYGVYRAAQLSSARPLFFGAKVVVDRADEKKGDKYHEYGCALSARFVTAAIEKILKTNLAPTGD